MYSIEKYTQYIYIFVELMHVKGSKVKDTNASDEHRYSFLSKKDPWIQKSFSRSDI